MAKPRIFRRYTSATAANPQITRLLLTGLIYYIEAHENAAPNRFPPAVRVFRALADANRARKALGICRPQYWRIGKNLPASGTRSTRRTRGLRAASGPNHVRPSFRSRGKRPARRDLH